MLLDGDSSGGALCIECGARSLALAQLGGLAEAAAGKVPPHSRLYPDRRLVPLHGAQMLSTLLLHTILCKAGTLARGAGTHSRGKGSATTMAMPTDVPHPCGSL